MPAKPCFARLMALALLMALAACVRTPPVPDMRAAVRSSALESKEPRSATLPFLLDDNRVFVELTVLTPDGGERKILAWVNMGSGAFGLSNALFRELNPGRNRPLRLKFGDLPITLDGRTIQPMGMTSAVRINLDPFSAAPTPAQMARQPEGPNGQFFAPLKVEAIVSPGLLQHFQVVFDYGEKTMTLAAPGTLQAEGLAVPMRVNRRSGFSTLDATWDGKRHALVIDNGGSFTTLRDVAPILDTHPQALRSEGGIGEANYLMAPGGADALSPVVKIADAALGPLKLEEMDALQPRFPMLMQLFAEGPFWDFYSEKAGERIEGWLGGNLLRRFRLTLDYPARTSYWLAQAPHGGDLDQVGIVLGRNGTKVTITGIAKRNGAKTVSGAQPGDTLLKIGGLDTATATRGQLLTALHGRPGETRRLLLERGGKRLEIEAPVTGF